MAISIKNERAEELARELARETGCSLTDAVIDALEEKLKRIRGRRAISRERETAEAICRQCRDLPDLDTRPADEILGYDERGLF